MCISFWQKSECALPYPEDRGGDVRNLAVVAWRTELWGDAAIRPNDSNWIDIGCAGRHWPGRTEVQMLVAPLIIDLDGRINLNIAGTQRSAATRAGVAGR